MPSDGAFKGRETELEERMTGLTTELWGLIIEHINHVLTADRYYGFAHFDKFADPSIEQILEAIAIIEPLVVAILASQHFKADPERAMKLLNCQMAVHLIKRTNVSLKSGNEEEYRDCIRKLSTQRQH
ncbi:hypothetical protein [Luteibacter yeojuensis]